MSRLLIGLALFAGVAGCGGDSTAPSDSPPGKARLETVQLALNWYPEAEHGGFYAALVHGYYEEAGLDVEILRGGPDAPVIQRVAGKGVTFGVENADGVLLGRAEEADVVGVMAPLQTSPRCILVHEASEIGSFDELKNVTLAMSQSAGWAKFVRKTLPLEGVRVVPTQGSLALFLRDERFAQQGYVFSEPFVAAQEGVKTRSLMVAELDYNPYTSLIVVHGDTIRQKPELVRKMVQASVRGWQKYLEDPGPTNRRIHELNPEMSLEILTYGVKTMEPLCIDESTPPAAIGRMTRARWQALHDRLVEIDELRPGSVDVEAAFTTEFLPQP